jgi:hypothetical protein
VRNMAERVVALLHPYPDLVLGFNQVRLRLWYCSSTNLIWNFG